MARQFSGTSDLQHSGAIPLDDEPITMNCWFNAADVTANHRLLWFANSVSAEGFRLAARGDVAGDPLRAFVYTGSQGASADSTTGFSANTWHMATGSFVANNSRKVWLDNGSGGSNATNRVVNPTANLLTSINLNQATSLKVCEAGVWNVELTADERAQLYAGATPLMVRPQSLVAYWPLLGGDLNDWVGGYNFTATGTSVTDHPDRLLVYPSPAIISTPVAAAPPAAPTPMMFHSF